MTASSTVVELQAVSDSSKEGPAQTEETANNESPSSESNGRSIGNEIDSNKSASLLIVFKNRPTLALIGEPSHNIQKKVRFSISFVFAIIVIVCIVIGFLSSLFFPHVLYEYGILNMLHWIEDRSNTPLLNFLAVCFTIFDVTVFCISANASVLLAIICGFLYSWTVGSVVYIIMFAVSNVAVFVIGRTLFRDRMYSKIDGNERSRYAYRVMSDQSMAIGIALYLCPFIPAGIVSYVLSLTRMPWTYFIIAVSAVVPSTVLLAYSASLISDSEDIGNAYQTNDVIFGCLILLSLAGVLLLVGIFLRLYIRYMRSYSLAAVEQEIEDDGETDGKSDAAEIDEDDGKKVKELAEKSQESITKTTVTEGEIDTHSDVQTTAESVDIGSVENSDTHSSSFAFFIKEEMSDSRSVAPQSKHADLAWLKFENQSNANGDQEEMLFTEDFKKSQKIHKKRVEVIN